MNTAATELPRRALGRAGPRVTVVGYGAWGIGGGMWGAPDDTTSLRALELAIASGVNLIDTALAYGPHHSERLVGRAVRRAGEQVLVATKVPPKNLRWPAGPGVSAQDAFPAAHVRQCVERSLTNLGTDAIDLLQFHVWRDEWLHQGDWQEVILSLRDEGKIRSFGVSANDHEPGGALAAASSGLIDTVQVIYNIFEQAPRDDLLPACAKAGTGVIARVPFDEGALTGRLSTAEFPPGDFRSSYFGGGRMRQVHERVAAIAADLGIGLEDLADLALRFAFSHPAVACVIAGMRSPENVARNVASAARGVLEPAQLELLARHRWDKNFYAPPDEGADG